MLGWLVDFIIMGVLDFIIMGPRVLDFPAWALAARVAFAISPNSAACERVFALLKNMFGEQQMSVLKDYIQAALMLRSNKRIVG